MREFRSREDAERLRDFISTLRSAVWGRVETALGPRKLGVLRRLLTHPAPDILGVLGRANDENSHSEVLRWLLDPKDARGVAPSALRALVATLDDAQGWQQLVATAANHDSLSVRREYAFGREWATGSLDRIDIVITGPGFVIAIENKVAAAEHDNQTHAYWEWLSSLQVRRAGFFLSPSGIAARCSSFRPLSYLDLLACLLEGPAVEAIGPDEETVLAGYAKTLAKHVLRTELTAIGGGGAR